MDDIQPHIPASSITPNANVDAHLYSADAKKFCPLYTPCQFNDSFGNLKTVTSGFKDFHLSINYNESPAPTIVTAAAEPLCTQLNDIALGGIPKSPMTYQLFGQQKRISTTSSFWMAIRHLNPLQSCPALIFGDGWKNGLT
jgi:hypothetical protein